MPFSKIIHTFKSIFEWISINISLASRQTLKCCCLSNAISKIVFSKKVIICEEYTNICTRKLYVRNFTYYEPATWVLVYDLVGLGFSELASRGLTWNRPSWARMSIAFRRIYQHSPTFLQLSPISVVKSSLACKLFLIDKS